jgi:uncharacterized protein (DUF1778 family)
VVGVIAVRSEQRQRDKLLAVRVTADERDQIHTAAADHGHSVSRYLRDSALGRAALRAALRDASAEVDRIRAILTNPYASWDKYGPMLAEARGVARGLARAIELNDSPTPPAEDTP